MIAIHDLPAGDPRWPAALPVLRQLRPHLSEQLLADVLAEGSPQGLRFIGAFEADGSGDGGEVALGVAGWRIIANTSALRKLYVDDLVTAADARSRGVGAALLSELETRARAAGCRVLDLDSGVQRHDAHRFYLRERMDITAHHFAIALADRDCGSPRSEPVHRSRLRSTGCATTGVENPTASRCGRSTTAATKARDQGRLPAYSASVAASAIKLGPAAAARICRTAPERPAARVFAFRPSAWISRAVCRNPCHRPK